ncbi:MAG: late competence development ComFB family protein [Proteobacteria bacterium]|nr:late competence development ComFB family protein [Pseudomonadota bacterium]MBU1610650.1 late competence development ComFB family protein [Pseudomonadota bacterium]
MSDLRFQVVGFDLSDIRNTTEERVARQMQEKLAHCMDYCPDETDVKDIYALTLNSLPARHIQYGSLAQAVSSAIEKVRRQPRKC